MRPSPTGSALTPRAALTRLQVGLVALLVLSAVLNYIDRQAIAAVSPTLKQQFHLSDTGWGWINSSFSFVYLFTTSFGGAWIDRVGVRRGLLASTIVWSLAAAGHAMATGFSSLCFWRGMLAVGEGPGASSLLKGVRRLLPPRLRDAGTSLVGAGSIAGALIAPLTVIPLTIHFGWRWAFAVSAGFSLLWLPFWAVLASRRNANLGPEAGLVHAGSDHHPQRLNLRSPALWATLLAIFFTVPPTVFVQNFLALYLSQAHHLTQAQLGRWLWQPFLATDLGQLTGGAVAYLLLRRGWQFLPARRLIMVVGFLGSTLLLTVNAAPDVAGAMLRLDLSRFSFQAAYTILLVYGIESVPEPQTALMSGLMNATFSACNFIFNPVIGGMADHFRSYRPVIAMIGLSPLLGLACWLLFSYLASIAGRANEPRSTSR
jgi:ACS family hexuronate transporter-like MFS transporter